MCVQKCVWTKSRPRVHCGEAPLGLSLGGGRVLPSPSFLPSGRGSPGSLGLPEGNQEKPIRGVFLLHPPPPCYHPLLPSDSKSSDLHLQPTLEQ